MEGSKGKEEYEEKREDKEEYEKRRKEMRRCELNKAK
jgi:hypothetical protein